MPGPGLELRLSAARTRSDWSKTFPARFFENGRVEEGGGGKGGRRGHCYRIVANLGHDRICCCCVPQTHSVKILLLEPLPGPPWPQRIFFVSVLMLTFLCPAQTLFAAGVNALHFLWTCSQNPNLEMTRRRNIYFHEVGNIKYANPFPPVPICP